MVDEWTGMTEDILNSEGILNSNKLYDSKECSKDRSPQLSDGYMSKEVNSLLVW